MECVYAAFLLEAADSRITTESVSHVLGAVDVEVNPSQIQEVVEALDDIDTEATVEDVAPGPQGVDPYIYGALLLHGAGVSPTEAELSKVMRAAGLSPDQDRAAAISAAIQDIDIDEVIEEPATASSIANDVASAATEERKDLSAGEERTTPTVDRIEATGGTRFERAIDGLSDLTLAQRRPSHVVYRGILHDSEDRQTIQLRTLADGVTVDEDATQEILDVVRGWRNVATHPNVAEIRRWGETPQPWLLVSDQPIPFAAARPRMNVASACDVVGTVAEALRNGALYNTYHGNLTPWTVNVGTDRNVTVDDWGLERVISRHTAGTYLTGYTAPEQVADDVSATAEQTDVFGLGALAYCALTGVAPFDARESVILDGEFTPPSEVHEDLPAAVDNPVADALKHDPAKRPDGIYAFKTAFDSATRNLPETSVLPAPAERKRSVPTKSQNEPERAEKREAGRRTGSERAGPAESKSEGETDLTEITGIDAEPDEPTGEGDTAPESGGEGGAGDGLVDGEDIDTALGAFFDSNAGEPGAMDKGEAGSERSRTGKIPPAENLARRSRGNVKAKHLSESESNLPIRTYLFPDEQPHYYFENVNKGLRYTHPDWDDKRTPYNVGFSHRGRRFLLVTDKRVLFVGGNVGEQDDCVSFPYDELVDAFAKDGFLKSSLTIAHQDGRKIAFFDDGWAAEHLEDAAEYIRERVRVAHA